MSRRSKLFTLLGIVLYLVKILGVLTVLQGSIGLRKESGSKTIGDWTKDRDIETEKVLQHLHLNTFYVEHSD